MDVTCERCSTEYDFDDALVSERGTTVKCTNCGHQFKVRRADNAGAPERWVVRTVDGRELVFRALRELQTSIAQAQISRDDVLSRGGSRPRRLGSIAELEPFFSGAGGEGSPGGGTSPSAPPPRRFMATAPGFGPVISQAGQASQATQANAQLEGSVAIPLPAAPPAGPYADDGEAQTTLTPAARRAGSGPPARRPPSIPPPLPTASYAASHPAPPNPRGFGLPPPQLAPPQRTNTLLGAGALHVPQVAPPPRLPHTPPPTGRTAPVRQTHGYAERDADASPLDSPATAFPPTSEQPTRRRPPEAAGRTLPAGDAPRRAGLPDAPTPGSLGMAETLGAVDFEVRPMRQTLPAGSPGLSYAPPPTPGPAPDGTGERAEEASLDGGGLFAPGGAQDGGRAELGARASEGPLSPPVISSHRMSEPALTPPRGSYGPSTPTPSIVRGSIVSDESYGEPRFSSITSTRRTGAGRWIAGFVFAGMLALAMATVGRKFLASGAKPAGASSDERIATFLREGEKSLLEGDFESAKEQFDKASALAEGDPHAVEDLARLATIRADVPWLRVRLLKDTDPDRAQAKAELELVAARARKASDRAFELAPGDAAVARSRVDALRETGDLEGARKLAQTVAATSSQPDSALSLAALDLAEDKPSWATVVERLRTAASAEQNLGRARSMLVYALARSGDLAGAKAELEKLKALPHPHPLVAALKVFLDAAGKGIDPSTLPAVGSEGDVPSDYHEALHRAAEARARGDLKRAEQLYQAALLKHPGDTDATTALADLAKARSKDRPRSPDTGSRPTGTRFGGIPDDYVPPAAPGPPPADLPLPARSPASPPSPPSTGEARPVPPTPPPPSNVPPGVDTSDLPGFK